MKTSILGRAFENGTLSLNVHSLRSHGEGPYRSADDRPFGGGSGMVLLPTVIERALGPQGLGLDLEALENDVALYRKRGNAIATNNQPQEKPFVVALSPQGRRFDAPMAQELASKKNLVFLCGHYEGFDERTLDAFAHLEVSIGDYVLTGGEPAALVMIDAISRFVPGVVGKQESVIGDTFGGSSASDESTEIVPGGLKHAQYTRPNVWRGREVPEVLLSGHHQKIRQWRLIDSERRTIERRPDLLEQAVEYPAYVALLHSPMLNKAGEEVCTAVTNLDLHDIARSCRTYGIEKYFVVNPEPEQETLVGRILGHWHGEISKVYHPARAEALSGVEFKREFSEVVRSISEGHGGVKPFVVMPDARDLRSKYPAAIPGGWSEKPWTYEELRSRLREHRLDDDHQGLRPLLIVFGTGWGIAPSFFEQVDQPLAPLRSGRKYNHLSVRAAAAIVLDRVFGRKRN